MNQRVKDLTSEARKLSPDELAELVDEPIVALYDADPDWNRAWAAEAQRRMEAYERGEVVAIPAEDVLRRLGKR